MGSKSSVLGAVGAVVGGVVGSIVPGVGTAIGASIGAGLGGATGMSVGTQMDATKEAKKAASKQEALIKEQENAVAAEKEKANAVRRSAFANKSQTTYSSALGEYSSDVFSNVRKKTLLGG